MAVIPPECWAQLGSLRGREGHFGAQKRKFPVSRIERIIEVQAVGGACHQSELQGPGWPLNPRVPLPRGLANPKPSIFFGGPEMKPFVGFPRGDLFLLFFGGTVGSPSRLVSKVQVGQGANLLFISAPTCGRFREISYRGNSASLRLVVWIWI